MSAPGSRPIELRKPEACPKCQGTQVRRIVYGFPTAETLEKIQQGEAVLGHCFVEPWLPDWRCGECRHEWFDAEDPAKQEIETLLGRILRERDGSS